MERKVVTLHDDALCNTSAEYQYMVVNVESFFSLYRASFFLASFTSLFVNNYIATTDVEQSGATYLFNLGVGC